MRPVCAYKYITALCRLYILCGMDGGWWNGRGSTVSLIYQWLCDTRQCSDSARPLVAVANGCFAVGPISLLGFLSPSLYLSPSFPLCPYNGSHIHPSSVMDWQSTPTNPHRYLRSIYATQEGPYTVNIVLSQQQTFLSYLDKVLEAWYSWTDG